MNRYNFGKLPGIIIYIKLRAIRVPSNQVVYYHWWCELMFDPSPPVEPIFYL